MPAVLMKPKLNACAPGESVFTRHLGRANSLRKAIGSAAGKGSGNLKAAQHAYFTSHSVKVAAAYTYYSHRFPAQKPAPSRVFLAANAFKWGYQIQETVAVLLVPKGAGGHRLVCDFGPAWRSAAYGLKPILEMHLRTVAKPFQHFFEGYKSAIREAKTRISAGFEYACHLDIKDFYPSIRISALGPVLPLPMGVAGHVCALNDAHVVTRGGPPSNWVDSLSEQARLSLPQGLPIAPLIAEIVIANLVWKNAPGIVMINFADNFLILGKSEARVDKAAKALRAKLEALAGGPFVLKPAAVVHLSEGCEFLGHDLQLLPDGLLTRPSFMAQEECSQTLQEYENSIDSLFSPQKDLLGDKQEVLAVAGKMRAYLSSWLAAFSECDGIDEFIVAFESMLSACLGAYDIGDVELAAHYDKNAEFEWHEYAGN